MIRPANNFTVRLHQRVNSHLKRTGRILQMHCLIIKTRGWGLENKFCLKLELVTQSLMHISVSIRLRHAEEEQQDTGAVAAEK